MYLIVARKMKFMLRKEQREMYYIAAHYDIIILYKW